MISFIDLFAGIGGMRLGFQAACKELHLDSKCVLSSEIEPRACETYKQNFGDWPKGDIRAITDIPQFDFLLAGFPCQPFSYAGKQKGFVDTRGTLFFEVERILKKYKPRGFLLENVRGLTTHDEGKTLNTILSSLRSLGYGVNYVILNSSNFGVPQNRVRIYILGLLGQEPSLTIKSDKGAQDSHKFKKNMGQFEMFDSLSTQTVRDVLERNVEEKYFCSKFFESSLRKVAGNLNSLHGVRLIDYRNGNSIHSWELGIKGKCTKEEIFFMNALIQNRRKKIFGRHQDGKMLTLGQIRTFHNPGNILKTIHSLIKKGYLKEVGGKYNPVAGNMSFEVFKFLDLDSISITLVSSDAHKLGVSINNRIRRLTPRECARLQGFPDSFKIHSKDTFAYRQFGNSVSIPVVREVIKNFLINNFKPSMPAKLDLKAKDLVCQV